MITDIIFTVRYLANAVIGLVGGTLDNGFDAVWDLSSNVF